MGAKKTIQDMQKMAGSHGGRCLSTVYVNGTTKLLWRCSIGHEWETLPSGIQQGNWCPACVGKKRKTIEDMRNLAKSLYGECLSEVYVSNHAKLLWRCAQGHEWQAIPSNVQQRHWCPICAGNQPKTIQDMQKMAGSHGGRCLSTVYVNGTTKLLWRCSRGHEWETLPSGIQQGNWCPACVGKKRKTIEDMRLLAESRGGKCLSEVCTNTKSDLLWCCSEGHKWWASPNEIQQGNWCPSCSGRGKTIEDMKKLAKSRGGNCLSQIYAGAHRQLRWRCVEGHEWRAKPNTVQSGSWCPLCKTNISERICRGVFESLFNERFPKIRPDWLVSPEGHKMELDGYCAALRLAFEYNGEQHYTNVGHFHEDAEAFAKRREADDWKVQLCNGHRIRLFVIPYTIKYDELEAFIRSEANTWGVSVPRKEWVDWRNLARIYDSRALNRMQEIALSHGGRCLSKTYIDSSTKLLWECSEGHRWDAQPNNIQRGAWCPKCRHRAGALKREEHRRLLRNSR